MAKQKKVKKTIAPWSFILIGLGVFLLLSLTSYQPNDVSYYRSPPNSPSHNFIGPVGAWCAFGLYFVLGLGAYIIPLSLLIWGIFALKKIKFEKRPDIFAFAWSALLISTSGLLTLAGEWLQNPPLLARWQLPGLGGITGAVISNHFLIKFFGRSGTALILATICIVSLVYLTELRIISACAWLLKKAGLGIAQLTKIIWLNFCRIISLPQKIIRRRIIEARQKKETQIQELPEKKKPKAEGGLKITDILKKRIKPVVTPAGETKRKIKVSTPTPSSFKPAPKTLPKPPGQLISPEQYQLPPLDLLEAAPIVTERDSKEDLTQSAKVLEKTLAEFGISIRVTSIQRGPVVTLYEISLAPGTKVGKITALGDDIALGMRVGGVRIIAPIPGKAAVGIEVPNTKPKFVYLREVLTTPKFVQTKAKLPLALGMDVAGHPLISDLSEMPHLLIAGTTGSGKTVCLNALILSLLFKRKPDELKMLMVDPKMVELSAYKNIPHLIVPLIHDPKKASLGLAWVVREMERRYELFATTGVRNLEGFNTRPGREKCKKLHEMDGKLTEIDYQQDTPATLPYIVIIIDELADLMMVAQADIETAIGRLAQLSRAVGIHIVLATQRPSVDVLTGVIKANFSCRISFQVASKVDSRTVLDTGGADTLLGKGDMLFVPPGSSKLIRAQCTLVRDAEIRRVVDYIVSQQKAQFGPQGPGQGVFHKLQKVQEEMDEDPLFQQAVDVVLTTQQASVSVLQRKLRIGYNRAARIVDMMEARGIVSPLADGKRDILLDRNEIFTDS